MQHYWSFYYSLKQKPRKLQHKEAELKFKDTKLEQEKLSKKQLAELIEAERKAMLQENKELKEANQQAIYIADDYKRLRAIKEQQDITIQELNEQIQRIKDEAKERENFKNRLLNELDKVKLFGPGDQEDILKALRNETQSDLYRNFDLEKELEIKEFSAQAVASAIISKNMSQVSYFLLRRQFFDFDITLLNYWLLKLLVDKVPMTFAADQPALIDKIEFVSGISNRIRKGELELQNSSLFDYISLNLLK